MGRNFGCGWRMFIKKLGKSLLVFCVISFVVGILMALFLPPIFIAVTECLLLIFLCICIYCDGLF